MNNERFMRSKTTFDRIFLEYNRDSIHYLSDDSVMKVPRLFAQSCLRKPSTTSIVVLIAMVYFTVLLWKRDMGLKEFMDRLTGDQRFLEHTNLSKKLKSVDEFQSLYSVLKPTNRAIAWRSVEFVIKPRSTNGLLAGRTSFRGEATSEFEVLVLDIKHVSGDVYRGGFKPSFGGEYKITVLLTYVNGENFNYSSHRASIMTNIEGSPFVLSVESQPPPEDITRYCSQLESGTARGRWVRCGSLRGIEECSKWQVDVRFDFDKLHRFFWLPYSCQLHYYSDHEMKVCLAKNGWEKIIFTGDSHTRYRAYHWVTRLYGNCFGCDKTRIATRFGLVPKIEWVFDARGTRWPATFPSISKPTEIYINPKTRRSMFSDPLPESIDDGDLYLMNFGHWLLREVTFDKFMVDKLRAHIEAVKFWNSSREFRLGSKVWAADKPKRFLWVNTMSLRWREDEDVRNWTMTPSPSNIGYMNSFIDRAMKDEGIQVVDAFQVSNGRLNAVHDATHYAKVFLEGVCAGAVENAVTNLILNALCNQ